MCYHSQDQTDRHTDLNFGIGQVAGYVGQVCRSRSKVKVTRSKKHFNGYISMECLLEIIDLLNITVVNTATTATWGVFKAYAFFFWTLL